MASEPQNQDIANIYERMLQGDKSALSKLQQVQKNQKNHSPLNQKQQFQNSPTKTDTQLEKVRKSENYRTVGNKKMVNNQKPQMKSKSIDKILDSGQFKERKPFGKNIKKPPQTEKDLAVQKSNETAKVAVPLPKLKTTSENFQQKMKKNIVKDEEKELSRSPPSSKNSLRVKNNLGQKKLIEELLRINQEQRKLQSQILQVHNRSKDDIDRIFQEYSIKIQRNKLSKKDEQTLFSPTTSILEFLKQDSFLIREQEEKIETLNSQIEYINKDIKRHKAEIVKKQANLDMLPLNSYLQSQFDIFEQLSEEEEDDEIAELPVVHQNKDPQRTYQTTMSQIRKKNYGLQQRIGFEAENKNQSKVESPKKIFIQKSVEQEEKNHGENKVTVNSRLKQFLFD